MGGRDPPIQMSSSGSLSMVASSGMDIVTGWGVRGGAAGVGGDALWTRGGVEGR